MFESNIARQGLLLWSFGAPPSEPRLAGDASASADDAWKTSYDYSVPLPATVSASPEDQRLMQQVVVEQWGFHRVLKVRYSRKSARVVLQRHLRRTMAYGVGQFCEADAARLADLCLDSFKDPAARFFCNWLGDGNGGSFDTIRMPGEDMHAFEFIMVGVQSDHVAAVATWDED